MSKIVINQDFNYVSDGNDIITDLDALSDVNVTAAANGQILVYNGTSNKWENADNSEITGLTALSDVTITSVADDQFLRYDSTSGEWVNETISIGGASELDELTDVTITSVADNQFLRYDSGSSQFVNETVNILTDVTGESIWDLSDVSTSGRVTGGVLHYNGSNVVATSTLALDLNIGSTLVSQLNNRTLTLKPITTTAGQAPGLYLRANQTTSGNGYKTGTIESSTTTSGYRSSKIEFKATSAGDGSIDFTVSNSSNYLEKLSLSNSLVEVYGNTNIKDGWLQLEDTSGESTLYLYRNETPTVNNTVVGSIQGYGRDDGGNVVKYTHIDHVAETITDGSEDGKIIFRTMDSGAIVDRMVVNPTGVTVTGTVTADTLDGTVIDGGTY